MLAISLNYYFSYIDYNVLFFIVKNYTMLLVNKII